MERAPCTGTSASKDASWAPSAASAAAGFSSGFAHTTRCVAYALAIAPTRPRRSPHSINACRLLYANSTLHASLREMYLNIDTVATHEPPTASCSFYLPRSLVLYRPHPSLHPDRRRRKESACCRATAPLCFHLKRRTASQGRQRVAANHPAR